MDHKVLSRKTKSGNVAILYCIDQFSLWPVIKCVSDLSAATTARVFFEHVIAVWGVPKFLMTDKAGSFMEGLFAELAKLLQIKHRPSAATMSRSNGLAERMIQRVNQMIRIYADSDSNIDEIVPFIELCLRATTHSRIKISPHECVFGKKMRIAFPGEPVKTPKLPPNQLKYCKGIKDHLKRLHDELKVNKQEVKHEYKQEYDKIQNVKAPAYKIGQRVSLLDRRVKHHSDNVLTLRPYAKGPFILLT